MSTPNPTSKQTLYFQIPDYINDTGNPVTLKVGTDEYPLIAWDDNVPEPDGENEYNAFELLRTDSESGSDISPQATHYAINVELPTQETRMLKVLSGTYEGEGKGIPQLVLLSLWIPTDIAAAARKAYAATVDNWFPVKFTAYYVDPGHISSSDLIDYMKVWDRFIGPYDIAHFLCSSHPELANMDPYTAAIVRSVMYNFKDCPEYYKFGDHIDNDFDTFGNWSTAYYLKKKSGAPIYFPKSKKPAYQYDITEKYESTLKEILKQALTAAKAEPLLKKKIWHPVEGVPNVTATATAPTSSGKETFALTEVAAVEDSGSSMFSMKNPSSNAGFGIKMESASLGKVKLNITNSYVRYLSIYAQVYGNDGELITGDALNKNFTINGKSTSDNDNLIEKALQVLGAVDNSKYAFCLQVPSEVEFMGIPITDSDRDITLGWDSNKIEVGKIKILAGTLGASKPDSWDPVWHGLIYTTFFDLVLPTVAIGMTVGSSGTKTWQAIFKKPAVMVAMAKTVYAIVKEIDSPSHNNGEALVDALMGLVNKLVSSLLTNEQFIEAIAEYITAEEVAEAIPIVGKVLKVILLVSTIAELAQTTVEILKSPMCIDTDITVQMKMDITMEHDPLNKTMPAGASYYDLTLKYDYGSPYVLKKQDVSKLVGVTSYHSLISGLPVGGNVSIIMSIYAEDDTLIGHVQTKPFANKPPSGSDTLSKTITIKQVEHKLDANTRYNHYAKLGFEGEYHKWVATKRAPTATANDLNKLDTVPGLFGLDAITFNADNDIIGYGYQANFQNIPLIGHSKPESNVPLHVMSNIGVVNEKPMYADAAYMFSEKGLSTAPGMAYLRSLQESISLPSRLSPDKNHDFFFIDPIAETHTGQNGDEVNRYHVRQILPVIDQSVAKDDPRRKYDVTPSLSWGSFNGVMPDDFAIHANGNMAAICTETDQIMVLKLAAKGVATGANNIISHALPGSGKGERSGLVEQPIKVEMSPDGRILVLEAGNGVRVQAFDGHINPVNSFKTSKGPKTASFFPVYKENKKEIPLDIGVEAKGYIYVLMSAADKSENYLDVYQPDGTHLFRTTGVRCAGITVDLWRTVYALNYEMIRQGGNGAPEPSISQWLPLEQKS